MYNLFLFRTSRLLTAQTCVGFVLCCVALAGWAEEPAPAPDGPVTAVEEMAAEDSPVVSKPTNPDEPSDTPWPQAGGESAEAAPEEELTTPENEETGDLSFWRRSADWLVMYRDNISSGIEGMGRGIDRFFAGDEALQAENKSYARIRTSMQFIEGSGFVDSNELKFRLYLPATQRKFRLVIENDSDDDETLEEKNRPSTSTRDSTDENQLSAAFQFISEEMDRWKTKGEIGVRASAPPNPFVRHTARRRWDLNGLWSMKFQQRVGYYKLDGYRANEELGFERRLNDNWFYRMKTEFEWRETEDTMSAAQVFSFYNRIDDKKGINYQVGVIAGSLHHTVIEKSYFAIDYRQLLYKDWLYLDVIPEIVFPRSDDYDPTSSITFRLEIFFSEKG